MVDIQTIYEDSDVLAINKPAGIAVHGDGRTKGETLVDWITTHHPEMAGVGEEPFMQNEVAVPRPGVVHRLDKDTSGVLVFAKNQNAHAFLKEQFQGRKVEKTYRVLVCGKMKDDVGLITLPIGKSGGDFRRRTAQRPRGVVRDAVTEYKTLERFETQAELGFDISYVEVYPKTGRTHQIRVHMKALNHPVLCDSFYAPKRLCPPEMGRLALHSVSLELMLPSGKPARFDAPLPPDFEATLAMLRKS